MVRERFGRLDFLLHSLAFAPREALEGEYVETTRDAFLTALDLSAYSLAAPLILLPTLTLKLILPSLPMHLTINFLEGISRAKTLK